MITVFNKADLRPETIYPDRDGDTVTLAAVEDTSLDLLVETIRRHILSDFATVELLVPFSEGALISELNDSAIINATDYTEEGTLLSVTLTAPQLARFEKYIQ
jgi:GTP-binding protein HflX